MIEPTDEMIRAFSDADFSGCGNADWEDEHVRIGLAAVLALVERDYDVRRKVCGNRGFAGASGCWRELGHEGNHLWSRPS